MAQADPAERFDRILAAVARAPDATLQSARLPPPLHAATLLEDRYRVDERVRSGDDAEVYRATDLRACRRVAVGLAPAEAPPGTKRRFARCGAALAGLHHPCVVAVHHVGAHQTRPYVVMEWLHGPSLRRWRDMERPRWPEIVARYRDAGRGLAAAHRAGVAHRRFTAADAVVCARGRTCVMNFDLTRGATPGPSCRQRDQRAWSAALVHALSPERGAGPTDPPPPRWLRVALDRAQSPDPARHYPTMTALLRAVDPDRRDP